MNEKSFDYKSNQNFSLTKQSGENELRKYFNAVLESAKSNNEYPINLDEVWMLVYPRKDHAVRALEDNFIKNVDYQVSPKIGENPNGGRPTNIYKLTISCMEFFIARKVRAVFEVYRQVFHKTAESVQKFQIPQSFSEALMLAAKQAEQIESQQKQIQAQSNQIAELEKQTEYTRVILQSKSTALVTQIAQDYGMSARKFNAILRDLNIQHKVNNQWILYGKYLNKGYVQSSTFNFTRSDGREDVSMTTEWTQKGRMFLYNTLKSNNILPLIEQ